MSLRYLVGEDELLKDVLEKIQFRIIDTTVPGCHWDTTNLTEPTAYRAFDLANTQLWDHDTKLFQFGFLCTPRLSTIAIAYLINRLVQHMPSGQAYLNVGVWCGWSLFAGIIGNDNKECIGVDNFSDIRETGGIFQSQYELFKTPNSHFFEMDYEKYFAEKHTTPIGVYFYDGNHEYEHQLKGLELAHPFIASGGYALVDDTNLTHEGPYMATTEFLRTHSNEYQLILDVETPNNAHSTFWNGLMILKKK